MSEADRIIYGTLIGVAAAVGVIVFLGVRARQAQEAEGQALTVEMLRRQLGAQLLDGPLIWGVWQGLLSLGTFRLQVRDAQGAPVTEITRYALPQNGVLQSFELGGKRYECVKQGVFSGRSLLREATSGEVLFSCHHRALRLSFYRAESDDLLFELTGLSVFHRHPRLVREGREIGRLLRTNEGPAAPLALTLREPSPTLLALCFVLVSLR